MGFNSGFKGLMAIFKDLELFKRLSVNSVSLSFAFSAELNEQDVNYSDVL